MKDFRTGYLPGMDEKSWMEKVFSKPNLIFLLVLIAGVYFVFISQQNLHADSSKIVSDDTTPQNLDVVDKIDVITILEAKDSGGISAGIKVKEASASQPRINLSKNKHSQQADSVKTEQKSVAVSSKTGITDEEAPSPVAFDSKLEEKLESFYQKDIESLK